MSCLLPPACSFCLHYRGDDDTTDRECLGFKEIPDDIIKGFHDHKESFEGDNGFQFSLNEAFKDDFENVQHMKQVFNQYTKNDRTIALEKPVNKFSAWEGV